MENLPPPTRLAEWTKTLTAYCLQTAEPVCANISTTSRYLKTTRTGLQQYLKRFEEARRIRTSFAQTDADDAQQQPAAPAADTAKSLN